MDVWVAVLLSAGSSLLTAGAAYGLLIGRVRALEQTTERHEHTKASTEAAAAMTLQLSELKRDLDRRLDRIEGWVAPRRRDLTDPGGG